MKKAIRAISVLSLYGTILSCGEKLSPERVLNSEDSSFTLSGRIYSCPALEEIRITPESIFCTSYRLNLGFGPDSTVTAWYSYIISSDRDTMSIGRIDAFVHGRYSLHSRNLVFYEMVVPEIKPLLRLIEGKKDSFTGLDVSVFISGVLKGMDGSRIETLQESPCLPEGQYMAREMAIMPNNIN